MSRPARIAIAQTAMHWTAEANTRAMVETLAFAAGEGAELCVFPELALTGFHRRIVEYAKPGSVDAYVSAVRDACARHGIAASYGAPTHGDCGAIFGSQRFVDAAGDELGVVHKRGLTDPEKTFLSPGPPRPVFAWRGLRCTSVICREVEDHDSVCAEVAAAPPDLVFWPGAMSPEDGSEHVDPPRHLQQAQRLAATLGATVVQANWPNSLNHPHKSAGMGHSAVLAPDGRLLFRLPLAEPGIGVFVLGEPSYAWHPRAVAELDAA